jgi:small subunit ribosomal protein S1
MAPDDHDPEDFAALLAEYEQQNPTTTRRRTYQVGDSVKAPVVSISREAVFVDLGAKADGMLDIAELLDEQGKVTVAVGDILEARVVDTGKAGCIVLRRTLGRGPEARAELEQAFAAGVPVEGVVTGVNKGGVEVQVAGVRAFCPISQLENHRVEDAAAYVGQRLTFRITRCEVGGAKGRGLNLVLSRRALLEEEAAKLAAETRATLAVGSVVTGRVTAVKDYGAFVDLGGLEGMLHVSELGFGRVERVSDALAVGQEVTVQVLKIEKSDDPRRPERISLSLKALARDPWDDVATRLSEGSRRSGRVVRVEQYGAFVALAEGVEGLLHISELEAEGRPVRHAREAVRVGQELLVRVNAVDRERRRISLALAREDDDEGGGLPAAPAAPRSLGTFADLLQKPRK